MAVTNVWNVTQMDCYPEHEGEQDVVFTVHYNLTGTDSDYTGYIYGTVGVTPVVTPPLPWVDQPAA